ncbi:MAG: hypothetical protein ACI389_02895 [Methanobrevibacter sp.]|uniref:hypothetical protein n=1 Tax=Methanobrevibacter sp. TaxID=66852 RepID=UPI003F0915E4
MISMMDKRLELAKNKKVELENKLEKVKGTPREEDFRLQVEKLEQLIEHLQKE